jgi:hypothetical protein
LTDEHFTGSGQGTRKDSRGPRAEYDRDRRRRPARFSPCGRDAGAEIKKFLNSRFAAPNAGGIPENYKRFHALMSEAAPASSPPMTLAIANTYAGLHEALRARIEALRASGEWSDGSLPDVLIKQLLAPNTPRRSIIAPQMLRIVLQTLGLKLAILHDAEQCARLEHRIVQRDERRVTRGVGAIPWADQIRFTVTLAHLRKIGSKGGSSPRRGPPANRRSSIARKAALARWSKRRSTGPTT